MLNQQSPSLGAVIAEAIEARLVDVHTHLPGRVESYDAVTQRCSVQIDLRQARLIEDGSRVADRLPVVNNVPVAFGRGGGFRTTYPLKRGDGVWLSICEGSLDLWKPRGGDIDPVDDRRFHLSDAIAIVGIADFGHALKNAPTDRMSIGSDTGATIEITEDEARVGGNGATGSAHAIVVQSALTDFMTALTNAVTAAVGPAKVPLIALQTALVALNATQGWLAGTSIGKAT